ncbi:alpha/beta hydrolase [Chitinophaga caeni]|uniref:Alpha/beta hydrolase n=1 Tax=Chitinophaga caeni TaxID=2029983 RepID=A0A291QPV5_9BACT|nr:alpha/beta hydrolase [Chitinophaga caeni]ATL45933.1 alpha/beta hydrolase [Chitinophaga caeni]
MAVASKRLFIRITLIAVLLYVLGGLGLYFYQEKIIFHPKVLQDDFKFRFNQPFEEITIPVNDHEQLSAVLFKADSAKGIVLYFHGNANNISAYAKYAGNFTRKGYDVLMMDYRGFGKSRGKLTQQGMFDDALVMYRLARKRFEPGQIIIYGKSIGTAVATELASIRDCKRLILETPYYSIPDIAGTYGAVYPLNWILKFPLPTYQYLPKVTAPINIFHGTADDVVPYESGKKLAALFKNPADEFITVPGGKHNDLAGFPVFLEKLDSLLEQ